MRDKNTRATRRRLLLGMSRLSGPNQLQSGDDNATLSKLGTPNCVAFRKYCPGDLGNDLIVF
jgi:hypothetical protein